MKHALVALLPLNPISLTGSTKIEKEMFFICKSIVVSLNMKTDENIVRGVRVSNLLTFADVSSIRKGKVRGASLPQEYDLTRVVGGIDDLHRSWNTETPACQWDGVHCRSFPHVVSMAWSTRRLQGTVALQYLPTTLQTLYLNANHLHGEIILTQLPSQITYVNLSENKFIGSLDLTRLPSSLGNLFLDTNRFSGEVMLECLPSRLKAFSVRCNSGLCGSVRRSRLPRSLDWGKPAAEYYSWMGTYAFDVRDTAIVLVEDDTGD